MSKSRRRRRKPWLARGLPARLWKRLGVQPWLRRQAKRLRKPALMLLAVLALGIVVLSRLEAPPRNPEDLCAIFGEKREWYLSARQAQADWGVPEAVQMAIIYQESSFRARARPRRRILWIFPGPRRSSAYGYAQALDSTWAQFQRDTDQPRAGRHRFADVTQFVGWYAGEIHRLTGIAHDDAYRLYLAYHEGPGGYARGTYTKKAWLMQTARKVEARAARYQRQYDACQDRLQRWSGWRWIAVALLGAGTWWLYRRLRP